MSDTSGNGIHIQILILIVLTLINGFFSCSEMAIASVNRTRIKVLAETTKDRKYKTIYNLLEEPTKFLSTIQVAITLAGFLASASAATGFSTIISDKLESMNIFIKYSEAISIGIVTVILSYFTLIFGELVPKRIALQNPEMIAKLSVDIILLISKILSPFVSFLTFSTNIILRILGLKNGKIEEEVSEEEIRSIVELGKNTGSIKEEEEKMINSIFEFNDKSAKEIMKPRVDVFAIDISKPLEGYWEIIFSMKYSRIPVYEKEIDNIIGILNLKDIIEMAKNNGFDNIDIGDILHKPFFISEHTKIDLLFKEMKKSRKYMALIIDEYGGFSGLLTMEDLVEEIVGDIEDEYDDENVVEKIGENEYLIKGSATLDEIKNNISLQIESEKSNTLSGYIVEKIMKIPDKNCENLKIDEDNYELLIEEVKENRIEKVRIKLFK